MLGTGDSGTKAERTAILVIHGVGQQDPYETLDSFASGLATYFRKERKATFDIRPERIAHKDWTEVAIHFEFDQPATERGLKQLSLYEYYWAPYTQDKVSWRESLKFLLKADLTPLRYLAANLQMMYGASKKKWWEVAGIFLREILRAAMLFAPLGLLLLAAYWALPDPTKILEMLGEYRTSLETLPRGPLIAFLVCVILALAMLWFVWEMRKRGGWWGGRNIQAVAERTWTVMAVLIFLGFAWGAWCIASANPEIESLVNSMSKDRLIFKALALGVTIFWLRRILVDYVGDIAVYVSADKKTKGYEARSKILDGSTEALKRLLGDKKKNFDQVIVAGHSLGSVIAYDTINELLSQVWASEDQTGQSPRPSASKDEMKKLKGLVTFGSPLDKISYFFREQVSERQAYRAQILSFLHSFQKERAGREYGDATFKYVDEDVPADKARLFPKLEAVKWLNVYSWMDPVSGRLDFYTLHKDAQRHRWYFPPVAAHLKYWGDMGFYRFFGDELL